MFLLYYCFFFFKQKTAYEMRISDWSSDVCSSDLPEYGHIAHSAFGAIARANLPEPQRDHGMVADDFRSFLRQREIAYDARNITQIFATFCSKQRAALERPPAAPRKATPFRHNIPLPELIQGLRSETRQVGKECVRTCSTKVAPSH